MGKTTLAAARAVVAAGRGRRVLAVSTDPAHSLGDALDASLGPEPTAVPLAGEGGEHDAGGELAAVELAAEAAFERWMGARRAAFRAIAERGSVLTGEEADRLLALPLPGVDELLALLEVARLAREGGRDEVVVDTAPTAHTLRLLALPAALARLAALLDALDERRRVLAGTFGGGAEPDPLIAELEDDARRVEALLTDPERASFSWVLLPELLSLRETEDALASLAGAGVVVRELVVNRVASAGAEGAAEGGTGAGRPAAAEEGSGGRCEACAARGAAERAVLEEVGRRFPEVPVVVVPELPAEPRGVAALRRIAAAASSAPAPGGDIEAEESEPGRRLGLHADDRPAAGRPTARRPGAPPGGAPVATVSSGGPGAGGSRRIAPEWLDGLAPPGLRLLFFGGKGGVGKTTCAAAVALAAAAAEPARRVRLLSTDPAHSLADVLDAPLGDDERPVPGAPGGLTARELDAPRRWRELRESMAGEVEGMLTWEGDRGGAAATLDRRLVERLLEATPPGLDELMALASLTEAAGAAEAADPGPGETDGPAELLVVDTAATGHALRLLEMPELALRWDHALLSLLLDYRRAARLGRLAEELVALSRSLKRLRSTLADPARARFVAVTRAAELPRRETGRLLTALGELGIAVPAVVVNRLTEPSPGCPRCTAARAAEAREIGRIDGLGGNGEAAPRAILRAPAAFPPPRGPAALLRWVGGWTAAARREETDPRT